MELDLHAVQARLGGQLLGREMDLRRETGSTNTDALEHARAGAAEGLVLIAHTQSAGRGRLGRTWMDLPGHSLLLSLLLRPRRPLDQWGTLSLAAAVAAAGAIEQACGVAPQTKWPNDVLLGGRKIAGILLEARDGALAVGIGINVCGAAAELQTRVEKPLTTVEEVAGRPVSCEDLLVRLLQLMDRLYADFGECGPGPVVEAYRKLELTLGRHVVVDVGGERISGEVTGLDDLGRLLVRDDTGVLHVLTAGEVTMSEVVR